MLFEWESILLFVGGGHALIFGLIILSGTHNHPSKYLFGLLFILFSFHFIEYAFFNSAENFSITPKLYGYRYLVRLSMGPLFFFYVAGLISKQPRNPLAFSIHFIPTVVAFLLLFPILMMQNSEKVNLLTSFIPFAPSYHYMVLTLLSIASMFSMLIYFLAGLKEMASFKEKNTRFETDLMEIWALSLYRFTKVCVVVLIGYNLAVLLHQFQIIDASNLYLVMSLVLISNLIRFNVNVIKQNKIIPAELTIADNSNTSCLLIKIDESELKRIDSLVLERKLFLDSDLTLDELADALDMPAYMLSKKINNGYNKTFFRYINEFRINHAKNILSTSNNKILAVAYDSGFTHKASFHRTFKRIAGVTPLQFRLKSKDK